MNREPVGNFLIVVMFLCIGVAIYVFVELGNELSNWWQNSAMGGEVNAFIALNLKIAGEYLMIVGGVVAGAAILVVACYWIGKLALRWRRVVKEPLKEIVKLFKGE